MDCEKNMAIFSHYIFQMTLYSLSLDNNFSYYIMFLVSTSTSPPPLPHLHLHFPTSMNDDTMGAKTETKIEINRTNRKALYFVIITKLSMLCKLNHPSLHSRHVNGYLYFNLCFPCRPDGNFTVLCLLSSLGKF